jgi:hypothetical protein
MLKLFSALFIKHGILHAFKIGPKWDLAGLTLEE